MQAYFEEGCDIGDIEELVRLGVESGPVRARNPLSHGVAGRAGRGGRRRASRRRARHHRGTDLHLRPPIHPVGRPGGRHVRPASSIRSWSSPRRAKRRRDSRSSSPDAPARTSSTVAEPPCALHAQAVAPFLNLRRRGRSEGFDLVPVSSFRDFARQLAIWNAKFSGERPLLRRRGRALEAARLAPEERIAAILRWSALPGASRHHWGTDLDLIDRQATAAGYRVQLTAAEYAAAGPFAAPRRTGCETTPRASAFSGPSAVYLSGVQPEPWHFSFAPLAEPARRALDLRDAARGARGCAACSARSACSQRLDELHARYVASIDWP